MKITIDFIEPNSENTYQGWVASINEMPGMADGGNTKEEAFEELMISLKAKIAYDNNIRI